MRRTWLPHLTVAGVGLAGALASGCHDGAATAPASDYSVTVNGTIDGGTIKLVDVGGSTGLGGSANGPIAYAEVYATSKASACGWLDDTNENRADLVTLALVVQNNGGTQKPSPITVGTYSLGNMYDQDSGVNQVAQASLLVSDATCQGNANAFGMTGSITFTTLTSTELAGSYDVTFSTGDHLTGSFDAPVCTTHLAEPVDSGDAAPVGDDADGCHP